MLRFKLFRFLKQLLIWIGGNKPSETKFYLFTLDPILSAEQLWDILWNEGWGFNALSHTFRHQLYTMRKPVPPRHQYHLRFFDDGRIEGHFEVDPFIFLAEHSDGVDLRAFNPVETNALYDMLVK